MIPWQNRITVFGAGIMNACCFPLHHSVNALHSAKVTECSHMFSLYVMLLSTISCNILWWRHQMETFSALLAFVRGIHRIPVTKASDADLCLMFSLICAWINCWIKKASRRWSETPSRPLWRHCNVSSRWLHSQWSVSAVPFWRGHLSPKSLQQTPHSSPVRARCGVSVVIWSLIYDLLLLSHCRW